MHPQTCVMTGCILPGTSQYDKMLFEDISIMDVLVFSDRLLLAYSALLRLVSHGL